MIDTREQTPFPFHGYKTERVKLDVGDYSLKGLEDKVAVERKSHEDAYQCVGGGRARFLRCLDRLSALDMALIVIEPSIAEFCVPPPHTRIDQRMAMGSYISWIVQYRVPVVWAGSRALAERITYRFLVAYVKHRAVK